ELGIPLRWPGVWRARFVAAVEDALPSLVQDGSRRRTEPATDAAPTVPIEPARLQFTGPDLCGLAALDQDRGGRLLHFSPDGGHRLFTGERLGLEPASTGARLRMGRAADGVRTIEYRGPLLRFPDTLPFLDLEAGLARADIVEADIGLAFVPDHPGCASAGFGRLAGRAVVDGGGHALGAGGVAEGGGAAGPGARDRAALPGPGRAAPPP